MRSLAIVLVFMSLSCGGAEEGEACEVSTDCDNEEPTAPHAGECRQLTCIEAVCSYAGNEGQSCSVGTCDTKGMCVSSQL